MIPKVSIQIQDLDGSSFCRVFRPIDYLAQQGEIELVSRWHAFSADAVIFQRRWNQSALEQMRSLQHHGIRVIMDADDDYFHVPDTNPNAAQFKDKAFRRTLRSVITEADFVAASTSVLQKQYASFNSHTVLMPNTLDIESAFSFKLMDSIRTESKKKDQRIVIGWAGSNSHVGDFTFLKGFFRALYESYGNRIVFRFFGHVPEIMKQELPDPAVFERMIEFQPWVPVLEYPNALAYLGLDIALAPLVKNEFNTARSNLKWLEYSAAGAAVVASDLAPYQGTGALLNPNQSTAWLKCVSGLIDNPGIRQGFVNTSRNIVEKQFSTETAAEVYLNQLLSGLTHRRAFSIPDRQAINCDHVKVDVVIPVYNAPAETRHCIEAVLPELYSYQKCDLDIRTDFGLIIVDDASDSETEKYLQSLVNLPVGRVYRNSVNLGFVETCNKAASVYTRKDADLILLNSDTVPSPGFIRQLRETAYSDPSIGTVTAVSNHGSLASVPPVEDIVSLLSGKNFEPIVTPTGVGYCLYIKREVLNKYGLFSPDFGKGYGEENDFCMRIRAEYRNVIDPGCYVWHKGHASFGTPINQIQKVVEKHPGYAFEVVNFQHGNPLQDVRSYVLSNTTDRRKRILNISHSYLAEAGTEKHILDLSRALSQDHLVFTASPNAANTSLDLFWDTECYGSSTYYSPGWPITNSETPGYEEIWNKILNEVKPDVIHVHHLMNHPLGLLNRLVHSDIPIVVSLHDAYTICPDPQLYKCPGVLSCETCFDKHFDTQNSGFSELRRDIIRTSMYKAAAVVSPSEFMARTVQTVYPSLKIKIIQHGIDLAALKADPSPHLYTKLRFGFIGNLTERKGIPILLSAFRQFLQTPEGSNAELHLFGNTNLVPIDVPGIIYHGSYRNAEVPRLVSQFDIGIVPSSYAESYCYTLDELLAAGLPVLGTAHGALPERIEEGRNGWLVPPNDVRALAEKLCEIARDPSSKVRRPVGYSRLRTLADMAADYADLYKSLIKTKALKILP